jgi:hypothetical protein
MTPPLAAGISQPCVVAHARSNDVCAEEKLAVFRNILL